MSPSQKIQNLVRDRRLATSQKQYQHLSDAIWRLLQKYPELWVFC